MRLSSQANVDYGDTQVALEGLFHRNVLKLKIERKKRRNATARIRIQKCCGKYRSKCYPKTTISTSEEATSIQVTVRD
jgi:hypothetical protein